jgi:hypothetical protein
MESYRGNLRAKIGESLIDSGNHDLAIFSQTTPFPRPRMTPDERERMNILCMRIANEQDSDKFTTLIKELTDLLDDKRGKRDQEANVIRMASAR